MLRNWLVRMFLLNSCWCCLKPKYTRVLLLQWRWWWWLQCCRRELIGDCWHFTLQTLGTCRGVPFDLYLGEPKEDRKSLFLCLYFPTNNFEIEARQLVTLWSTMRAATRGPPLAMIWDEIVIFSFMRRVSGRGWLYTLHLVCRHGDTGHRGQQCCSAAVLQRWARGESCENVHLQMIMKVVQLAVSCSAAGPGNSAQYPRTLQYLHYLHCSIYNIYYIYLVSTL